MSARFIERPELTRIQANLRRLNELYPNERRKKFVERDPEFNRLRDAINRGYHEVFEKAIKRSDLSL